MNYSILQEMIVYPYKLDAQMCTYTMSIADLDMESALER
jgi:hypothetical protein